MKDIKQLYYNTFGVSFYWEKEGKTIDKRVQVVFKDVGMYLTPEQLTEFAEMITECENSRCAGCRKACCRKFLLKTPVPEVDLAVDHTELEKIKDLVEGTIFNIGLYNYLNNECFN